MIIKKMIQWVYDSEESTSSFRSASENFEAEEIQDEKGRGENDGWWWLLPHQYGQDEWRRRVTSSMSGRMNDKTFWSVCVAMWMTMATKRMENVYGPHDGRRGEGIKKRGENNKSSLVDDRNVVGILSLLHEWRQPRIMYQMRVMPMDPKGE